MTRSIVCGLLLLLALSARAQCQEAQGGLKAADELLDPAEVLRQMGADEYAILQYQLLSQALGPETAHVLLLMMAGKDSHIDDDLLGVFLLLKAAATSAASPTAVLKDGKLLVVDDGTVYVIDVDAMKVESSVTYRPSKKGSGISAALLPMFQQAKEKAVASACISNMKQLCLAAMMYAQDWDETLPSEQWPQQLEPYLKNAEIYQCPGAKERQYAFAINEALIGAKLSDIKRPAETVLFFESNLPDDLPFGGPDGLLMEPRHRGMITVGFVDGHCKLMKPEEAKKLLARDPFQ